jgi:2-haloacid dehalogenase
MRSNAFSITVSQICRRISASCNTPPLATLPYLGGLLRARDQLAVRAHHPRPVPALGPHNPHHNTGPRGMRARHPDFWQVTGDALDYTLDTLGLADAQLRQRLMGLYLRLEAFPEVPGVLKSLKAEGYATAILSNGSPEMLARVVEGAGLDEVLDHVISVEEVGVFKPSPRVYQRCCDAMNVAADQIAFQSSNSWDAWAASAFGMRVFWCNRYGQPPERLPGKPDAQMRTLAELPGLISRA